MLGLPMETPSRILRRLDEASDYDLPALPSPLPAESDAEDASYIEGNDESSRVGQGQGREQEQRYPSRNQVLQESHSPAPPTAGEFSREESPYMSTPQVSNQTSNNFSNPGSRGSTSSKSSVTQVGRSGRWVLTARSLNISKSLSRSRSALKQELSLDDENASSIEKAKSLEEEREDMVIRNGSSSGSGDEDRMGPGNVDGNRSFRGSSPRTRSPPPPQALDEASRPDIVAQSSSSDSEDSREPTRNGFSTRDLSQLDDLVSESEGLPPPPSAAPSRPSSTGRSSVMSDRPRTGSPALGRSLDGSRHQDDSGRLSNRSTPASDHSRPQSPAQTSLSMSRAHSPLRRSSTENAGDSVSRHSSDSRNTTTPRTNDVSQPAFSPVRELSQAPTSVPSPEYGRDPQLPLSRDPSRRSLAYSTSSKLSTLDRSEDVEESRSGNPLPSKPSDLAHETPRPHLGSVDDKERRKIHLLSALRIGQDRTVPLASVQRNRFKRGTPFVRRTVPSSELRSRSRESTPGVGGDGNSYAASVVSESTSVDLTTNNRANTSMPMTDRSTRFNGAKLNSYLHSLNTHLTKENQILNRTLADTNNELERMTKRNGRLEEQIRELSVTQGSVSHRRDESDGEQHPEGSVARGLEDLLEGHKSMTILQGQLADELGYTNSGKGNDLELAQKDMEIQKLRQDLENLTSALDARKTEVDDLREKVLEGKRQKEKDEEEEEADIEMTINLQRDVFSLRDELSRTQQLLKSREDDIKNLRQEVVQSGERHSAAISDLQNRADDLMVQLEERDGELDEARQALSLQQAEFEEANRQFDRDVSKLLEEERAKLEGKIDELEKVRREEAGQMSELKRRLGSTETELFMAKEEKFKLEEILDQRKNDRGASEDRISMLRDQVDRLETTIQDKEGQLQKAAEGTQLQVKGYESDIVDLKKKIADLEKKQSEAVRTAEARTLELQQLEEAFDATSQQLFDSQQEIGSLKSELRLWEIEFGKHGERMEELENQVEELQGRLTESSRRSSSKQPTNRTSNDRSTTQLDEHDDTLIGSLQQQLDTAHQEIGRLRQQLASVNQAADHLKDLHIKQLESTKEELESRVSSLKRQTSVRLSPNKTPEKSVMFKSILGVPTPKTPGHFLSNFSVRTDGSINANETITPLLAQIYELERQIEELQAQLNNANDEIDDKLEKLDAAGYGTLSLTRQFDAARIKIAELEAEVDRLLGDRGLLRMIKRRLSKMDCPECHARFDANEKIGIDLDAPPPYVNFDMDLSGRSGSLPPPTPQTEKLRVALGTVTARLATQEQAWDQAREELEKTRAALQSTHQQQGAELQKALTLERENAAQQLKAERDLSSQQSAQLMRDIAKAQREIRDLEMSLGEERARLEDIVKERMSLAQEKSALEARLAKTTEDLEAVRKDAKRAPTQDALELLRREKSDLVIERASHLKRLAQLASNVEAVEKEMAELRQSQASTKTQLDQRIAEIQNIREILAAKDADIERLQGENRALHDQRNAILSGVSNLQDDLNRLRADTVTLGNDLAAARKERDVMLARQAAAKDAEQYRRDSEVSKAAVSKLTKKLGQSQGIFEEAKAHHIREAKGLLLMIQYLKDRFSREAWFRADLCHQKEYLNLLLQEKQASLEVTCETLHCYGLRTPQIEGLYPRPVNQHPSFKAVALVAQSVARMSLLARRWKEQADVRGPLKEAYRVTRGRDLPPN